MKWLPLTILTAILPVLGQNGPTAEQAILGRWKLTKIECENNLLMDLLAIKEGGLVIVEISEKRLAFVSKDASGRPLEYTLNLKMTPNQIDVFVSDKKPSKGIFKTEKDVLKMCFSTGVDSPRPREYATSSGGQSQIILHLVREKKM